MSKSARKPQKQAKKATQEEAENEVPLLDVSVNGGEEEEHASSAAARKKDKRKADVLDPTQDPVTRRKIRQSYRALLEKPPEELQRVEDATALVLEANRIFRQVRMPREAVLDAEVLKRAAERGVESAQNVQANFRPRDPGQLLRKLRTFGRPQQPANGAAAENGQPDGEPAAEEQDDDDAAGADINWDAIAAAAVKHFAVAPVPLFFFGALEAPEKMKKTRQAANKREGKAALVRPEELRGTDLANADPQARETSRRVQSLLDRLEQVKRKNLYELLVNPQSFSQTMENFFHYSFLIKDGRASVELVDGVPFAQIRDQPDQDDQEEVIRTQCVFTLDHRMWKAMISEFNIRTAFLGHRQPSEQALELQKIAHTEVDLAAAAAARAERGEDDDEAADQNHNGNNNNNSSDSDASPSRGGSQPKKRSVQLQLTPTRAPTNKAKQAQVPRVSLKAAAAPAPRSKARAVAARIAADSDHEEDEAHKSGDAEEQPEAEPPKKKQQQNGTKRSKRTIQTSEDEEEGAAAAPAAGKRRNTEKTQEEVNSSQLVADSQALADATPAPAPAAAVSQSSSQALQASRDDAAAAAADAGAAAAESRPSASQHTLSDAGSSQLHATPSGATPSGATPSTASSGRKRRAKVLASDSE